MTIDGSLAPAGTLTPSQASPPEEVTIRLQAFQILPNRWLRMALALLPAAIVLWFTGGLLQLKPDQQADWFLITAFLTVVVELVLLRWLFERTPEVLRILWKRGLLLAAADGSPLEERYLRYQQQFEDALRHPAAHAAGLIFIAITIRSTFFVLANLGNLSDPAVQVTQAYWWRVLYLPIAYFIGLLAWRVMVIAYFIYRLGLSFNLKIQPNHPDRCGGLKPLGDVCLLIALLLLVPSIYYGVWGFIDRLIPGDSLALYTMWGENFRLILFALTVLALLAFYLPLESIHRQMLHRRAEIQQELDQISQAMDNLLIELRMQAATLSPQEAEGKLERLKIMQQVYLENNCIPVWPFEWKILLRFYGAQFVPLLSLVITSQPIITIFQTLLGLLGE